MSQHRHGLPDFVIIGAMRAGTTSLWQYLRSHPAIFMPDYKEPNFFLEGVNWDKGLDWYRSLFDGSRPDQLLGEASTGYTNFPRYGGTPKLLASIVPDVRLIYIIREPISRMKSAWVLMRSDYHEWRPLQEALLSDLFYLSMSLYAVQLSQYLRYFDSESILILRYEDLAADTAGTMASVCRFLGVDVDELGPLDTVLNSSSSKMLPRRRMRALEQGLKRAHLARVADTLRSKPVRGLTHLPLTESDMFLDDDASDRLMEFLLPDLQRLRTLVGPSLDLWGLA